MARRLVLNAPSRLGFSLVELLLTIVLVLLLLGAMAFNFSSLQAGAALQEGAEQFTAMLHMARARAAETGRNVLIQFDTMSNDVSGLAQVQVRWEPDPLTQPGVYVPLVIPGWDLQGLNELIAVMNVIDLNAGPTIGSTDELDLAPVEWPALRFFPDGSSDSAEIQLAARDQPDGSRRVVVRLIGLTGSISQRWVDTETEPAAETDAQPEPEPEPEPEPPENESAPDLELPFPNAAGQTL